MMLFQNCKNLENLNTQSSLQNNSPSLKNKSALGVNLGVFADQRVIDNLGDIGSWFYNYSPDPNRASYNSITWANTYEKEFVPMIHNKFYVYQNGEGQCVLTESFSNNSITDQICSAKKIAEDLKRMKKKFGPRNQPRHIIAFNEPYKLVVERDQAGAYAMDPSQAAEAYGKIIAAATKANLKVVSPSFSGEANALNWMSSFLKNCYNRRNAASNPCLIEKIDLLNTHEYNCTSSFWTKNYKNRGLKKSLINRLNNHGDYNWSSYINKKKIWVTETNCNWERDFRENQQAGKFSRNPRETCLRATGQKPGHGKGSLYEMQNMPEEIERFAWWNLYANPYTNSDLPNGVNSSSINRITAVRLFNENLERTVNGDAYYQAYNDPNTLKATNCTPKTPLVERVNGLFNTQTGLVFYGFGDFYCRYDNVKQAYETYGSKWQSLLKSVRHVPSKMIHAGKCGPLQGLRKQNNKFYYTFKAGYTCTLYSQENLENEAGFTQAEALLLKESNLSALGIKISASSCFN